MDQQNKLGFGLMRLPKKIIGTDIEQTKEMVDLFMDAGFTYFDTAYMYLGSENAIRKALVERYPRDSFTLASKLFAPLKATEKGAKAEFETSLKRAGTDYFDFYLLHSLMKSTYKKYDKFNLWDFVREEKQKGRIRHYGFSFHDSPELLDEILTGHPDVDFVQLQINYADWENPSVESRKNYEVARKHNKPIVIMEPVKGGKLANPPEKVKQILSQVNHEVSYASWALRFTASLDGVLSVLSGMSNVAQMKDNISFMKDFKPLNQQERQAINEAMKVFGNLNLIPCTSCNYCANGCPKNIPISEIFDIMNTRMSTGNLEEPLKAYQQLTKKKPKASECLLCGKCESICPQHIEIREELKRCARAFE